MDRLTGGRLLTPSRDVSDAIEPLDESRTRRAASPSSLPAWGQSVAMPELPVTLPTSRCVAAFKVPAAGMSELDYQTMVNSLAAMKPALVRPAGE